MLGWQSEISFQLCTEHEVRTEEQMLCSYLFPFSFPCIKMILVSAYTAPTK